MRFLADDKLEGRRAGTRGHELAAAYVAAQLEGAGLAPGAGGASFLQPVPFRVASVAEKGCAFSIDGQRLAYGDDVLATPDFLRPTAEVEAPLVFAGFGVTAPELGHDDYAGLDARGKIVVILSGAPPVFPLDHRAFYSHRFGKQENAAAHGAVGVVTILTPTDEKRRPWAKLRLDAVRPGARWLDARGTPADTFAPLKLVAALNRPAAERLMAAEGKDLAAIFARAESKEPGGGKPAGFPLRARLRARTATEHTAASSPNVLARLPGVGPAAAETIVVSAHLDHLGIGAPVAGDTINNGAFDNASGTAILIELARTLAAAPTRPRRSILFAAVTGEEMGLQGSDYLARFPPQDPGAAGTIVGNVNVDMVLMLGPLTHVLLHGAEHSTLGPAFASAAKETGMSVAPNPMPEEVVFVRSDQFSFVRRGIPAIFPVAHGTGDAASLEAIIAWRRTRYHAPSDDMAQPIAWQAGERFAAFVQAALWKIANDPKAPAWNRGDFFGEKFRAPAR
jgi:hypothetical protein